ncbi:MAG TPA: hypothetical protein PKL77_01375 [Candidatus Omnitrophota bacterium]|nr:hypothetical protein [Candidatus Omnitrophota bacterium]
MVSSNFVWNHSLGVAHEMPSRGWIQGTNGCFYDPHGIANVLIMVPLAMLEPVIHGVAKSKSEQVLVFLGALSGAAINSCVCSVFFMTLVLLGRSLKISLSATVCLAFATILFPYAMNNFEGNISMLCVISTVYCLCAYRAKNKKRFVVLAGLCAGFAITARDFSLVLLVCAGIFMAVTAWQRKKISLVCMFLGAAFPGIALWGYYNWLRTGIFYMPVVGANVGGGIFDYHAPQKNFFTGLQGLLLSPGGSLFVFSPIFLISLWGWQRFLREKKAEGILVLSLVISYISVNAGMQGIFGLYWFGFWGWGPRYILEITPLMVLPLAYCFSAPWFRKKTVRVIFFAVGIYSVCIQLAGVMTNWHGRLWYLIERKGIETFLWDARFSQWWDGLKTVGINCWNLIFGSAHYLYNAGYDAGLSKESLYTSQTIFTWWNRLLYVGVHPVWICIYLAVSVVVVLTSLRYVIGYIWISPDKRAA